MFGLVEVVRGQQHRGAVVAERLDQIPRLAARRRVEAGGRFVEEQQLRASDDAEGQVDATTLTAGERADPGVDLLVETDQADHLVERAGVAVATAIELDHLADRELGLDARRLQDDADAVAEVTAGVRGIDPQHFDRPRRGGPVSFEDLDGGRLAGAVRAEQGVHLAGIDRETQAVDRVHLAVVLVEIVYVDGGHAPRTYRPGGDEIGNPESLRRCSAAGTK